MKYRWRVSNHIYGVVSDPEHELPGSGKTTQCREERRFLLIAVGKRWPTKTRHCLATAKIFCPCGALEVLWEPSRSSSSGFHGDLWELLSTSPGGQQPVKVFSCLSPCPRDLPTHISRSFAQTEQEHLQTSAISDKAGMTLTISSKAPWSDKNFLHENGRGLHLKRLWVELERCSLSHCTRTSG